MAFTTAYITVVMMMSNDTDERIIGVVYIIILHGLHSLEFSWIQTIILLYTTKMPFLLSIKKEKKVYLRCGFI